MHLTAFIVMSLGKNESPARPRNLSKHPHIIRLPLCLTVLTTYSFAYLSDPDLCRTVFFYPLTSRKVDSSENMTFVHSSGVQCR